MALSEEYKYERALHKLWRIVDKLPDGGCWLVRGNRSGKYAQMVINGKREYLHRFVYELLVGPIPEGHDIGHRCHDEAAALGLCDLSGYDCPHHACVNPDHLEPQTRSGNLRASANTVAGINAAKTHCKRRHGFTPESTRIRENGWRSCKICDRMTKEERRAWDEAHAA